MGVGRNTINQGFRPGLITNLAGDVGNIAGGVVNAGVGDIPKNIGNAFFTQAGKFDGMTPEMLERLGTGLGVGSSVFMNNRR